MDYEVVIQTLIIIGSVLGVCEYRYKILHSCDKRIEGKLNEHIEKSNEVIREFDRLKGKLDK